MKVEDGGLEEMLTLFSSCVGGGLYRCKWGVKHQGKEVPKFHASISLDMYFVESKGS